MTSVNSSTQGGSALPPYFKIDPKRSVEQNAKAILAKSFDTYSTLDGNTKYISPDEIKQLVADMQALQDPSVKGELHTKVSLAVLKFAEDTTLANSTHTLDEQGMGVFTDVPSSLNSYTKHDIAKIEATKSNNIWNRVFRHDQTLNALKQKAKDNLEATTKPEIMNGLLAQSQTQQDAAKAISDSIVAQLMAEQAAAEQDAIMQEANALLEAPTDDWASTAGEGLWQSPEAAMDTGGGVPWYDQVDPNAILNPEDPAAADAIGADAMGDGTLPQGATSITAGDNTNINVYNQSPNPITTQLGDGASINITPEGEVTTSDGTPVTPSPTTPPTTPPTGSPTPNPSTPTSPTTPSSPATPSGGAGGQAANGIGTINAAGDVTVNIYNGDTTVSPTPPATDDPVTPPNDDEPVAPPDDTPVTPGPEFDINQRDNTISIAGGPSIELFENTVDTLDNEASSTFETDDDTVGGHMVFASGDDVWAAQKDGVSVVYWDPRQSLKDAGTTPTFEFYAAQPVTIDGVSKQGRLDDDDYILAVSTDQLPKLTGLPSAFQSAYDEMLNPSS
jgi:hypothetical protein